MLGGIGRRPFCQGTPGADPIIRFRAQRSLAYRGLMGPAFGGRLGLGFRLG